MCCCSSYNCCRNGTTRESKPINRSVFILRSWASSSTIAEYLNTKSMCGRTDPKPLTIQSAQKYQNRALEYICAFELAFAKMFRLEKTLSCLRGAFSVDIRLIICSKQADGISPANMSGSCLVPYFRSFLFFGQHLFHKLMVPSPTPTLVPWGRAGDSGHGGMRAPN